MNLHHLSDLNIHNVLISSDADVLQCVIPAGRTEYNLHVTNINFVFKCDVV